MLESLAACTIVAGKWDRASHFVNPMCGSGTLAIEAALMASNRAPGLLRNNYSFMHFVGYQEAIYLQEKEIIKNQKMSEAAHSYNTEGVQNSKIVANPKPVASLTL